MPVLIRLSKFIFITNEPNIVSSVLTTHFAFYVGDIMKVLHPELNGYTRFAVPSNPCRFFIKEEAPDNLGTLEVLRDIMSVFDKEGDPYAKDLECDFDYEFLGEGSFSKVIVHPNDATKVIKVMLRYASDSVCYQYLRLVQDGTLTHDWCPTIYSMGRIKVVGLTLPYHVSKGVAPLTIRDIAYVVMDKCDSSSFKDWDDFSTDILKIRYEFSRDVLDIYFPYAKLDVRGANVLVGSNGNLVCTDPVWNDDEHELPTVHIPYISRYTNKPLNYINRLRQELTHGRVW